jgi:hypothetical protein
LIDVTESDTIKTEIESIIASLDTFSPLKIDDIQEKNRFERSNDELVFGIASSIYESPIGIHCKEGKVDRLSSIIRSNSLCIMVTSMIVRIHGKRK